MRFLVLALALILSACAPPSPGDRIVGEWRGTSTCTDRTAAPACQDEAVRYFISAQSGRYHLDAHRLNNGVFARMYEADLTYSNADNRWTYAFDSPACPHCVWWYRIAADGSLTGGITSQAGMELRRVSALKL